MGQCKFCGRSGWFLSLTEDGLCNGCNPIVRMEIAQRLRIINDSMELIKKSKKLDVQVSRCELLLEHTEELKKYEVLGIPTIKPTPSEITSIYKIKRDELIANSLNNDVMVSLEKLKFPGGMTTKISHLTKVLFKIRDYKNKIGNSKLLTPLEIRLVDVINKIQLNFYLDEAKKAEFKGQTKKALDKYYEALYFLRHDEINDVLQGENISSIEEKISALGGKKEPSIIIKYQKQ